MTLSMNDVFKQYLEVVNRAIEVHRDEFPYKQILAAGERMTEGKRLGVAVYREDPDKPYDHFTIKFEGGRVELLGYGKRQVDATWKVKADYLRKVVDDPDAYIEHPAKLDLDWLKSRLGIDDRA